MTTARDAAIGFGIGLAVGFLAVFGWAALTASKDDDR